MTEPLETQEAPEAVVPAPPIQEKKKRVTVADLKEHIDHIAVVIGEEIPGQFTMIEKDLNEIRTESIAGLLNWCGELDARLDKIEEGSLSDRADVAADINARLDMLESTIGSGELQLRLGAEMRIEALEERTAKHNDTLLSDVKTRLDVLGEVTRDLADTMGKAAEWMKFCNNRFDEAEGSIRSLQTANADLPVQEEIAGIEFDVRPEPQAGGQAAADDIETVAGVCLTMNDVLMICRALKGSPEIPDQEKIRILNIACKAAGVPDAIGLRIRAGISTTEAAGGR